MRYPGTKPEYDTSQQDLHLQWEPRPNLVILTYCIEYQDKLLNIVNHRSLCPRKSKQRGTGRGSWSDPHNADARKEMDFDLDSTPPLATNLNNELVGQNREQTIGEGKERLINTFSNLLEVAAADSRDAVEARYFRKHDSYGGYFFSFSFFFFLCFFFFCKQVKDDLFPPWNQYCNKLSDLSQNHQTAGKGESSVWLTVTCPYRGRWKWQDNQYHN